jgi:hypothetical protein
MNRSSKMIVGGVLVAWGLASAMVSAKPMWVKKAKDMGYPAQNCMYCHTVKLPKKDEAKKELNDRGKWLVAQMEKKNAKEVDLEWLKDYPGGKEQK